MDEIVFAEIDEIPLVMNSIAHLDIRSSSSGIVDDTFDDHPKTDINSTTIESSSHTTTSTTRTSLRKRSSSADSLLHKTRNRKIERPQKRVVSPMTDSQIKNFYININKKVKLKPNLLETIFEQDEEDDKDDESSSLDDSESGKKKSISIKKFKRLLTLHDGLNATKALKDKRKSLIKKHLGARKHPKKMPKETFMEYLRKLNEEHDDEQAAT